MICAICYFMRCKHTFGWRMNWKTLYLMLAYLLIFIRVQCAIHMLLMYHVLYTHVHYSSFCDAKSQSTTPFASSTVLIFSGIPVPVVTCVRAHRLYSNTGQLSRQFLVGQTWCVACRDLARLRLLESAMWSSSWACMFYVEIIVGFKILSSVDTLSCGSLSLRLCETMSFHRLLHVSYGWYIHVLHIYVEAAEYGNNV